MTFDTFLTLIPRAQLFIAITRGTHLARRWNSEGRVNLYHMAGAGKGFFVELGYQSGLREVVVLRSFTHTQPLGRYTYYMPLPTW